MLQVGASALPANVPGVAAANPATQVPGAYGATSAAPVSPVQLPAAVAASGALLAYQANTPQPVKPAVRLASSNQPSSQLAAQYIAQTGDVSSEDLQLFAPVTVSAPNDANAEANAYLKDLRVANGEIPASANDEAAAAAPQNTNTASAASASARPSSAATPAAAPYNLPSTSLPTLATAAAINVFANRIAGQAAAPLQARPAPAPLVPQGKKPGIGEARGSDAYKVAESRNFFASFPTSVTAVY